MNADKIEGATRVVPGEWHGESAGLPIREAILEGGRPCMVSAWKPTTAELARLTAGACVELCVIGIVFPSVGMSVGPVPIPPDGVSKVEILGWRKTDLGEWIDPERHKHPEDGITFCDVCGFGSIWL